MRLMAGIAELAAGVFLRIHLGKALRLGDIFGVTPDAELGDVGELRSNAGGVFGVLGEGAVAGLAVHMRVHTFRFGVGLLRVTPFTSLMTGVGDGTRGDFAEGVTPEVAVAAEAFWNKGAAQKQEESQAEEKNDGHTEEMRDVFERDHRGGVRTRDRNTNVRFYSAGEHRTIVRRSRLPVMRVTWKKLTRYQQSAIRGEPPADNSEQKTAHGSGL